MILFNSKFSLLLMIGVSPVSSRSPDELLMADPGSVDTSVEQQSSFEPTEFSIGEV